MTRKGGRTDHWRDAVRAPRDFWTAEIAPLPISFMGRDAMGRSYRVTTAAPTRAPRR